MHLRHHYTPTSNSELHIVNHLLAACLFKIIQCRYSYPWVHALLPLRSKFYVSVQNWGVCMCVWTKAFIRFLEESVTTPTSQKLRTTGNK